MIAASQGRAQPPTKAALRGLATLYLQPLEHWAHQCHAASMDLLGRAGFEEARIARGSCTGVGGQHSWVVMGHNVYAFNAVIVDPTLWSYDRAVRGVWVGSAQDGRHVPQGGHGNIWSWGKPAPAESEPVTLTPSQPLSPDALAFVDLLGPLDRVGWMRLMDAPVAGWPAAEIVAAMDDTPALEALVPIDLLGMLTDRNPGGLYLP